MKVIAVFSTKGGVGKTTTAVNLAWEASRSARVLLWDLDPQGASTHLLGVKPKLKAGADALVTGKTRPEDAVRSTVHPGLEVIPADATYRDLDLLLDAAKKSTSRVTKVVDTLRGRYDVVVLDCPPGESLVARNALAAADLVVVPMPPSPLARRSLDQIRALHDEAGADAPILGFLAMVDRRKSVHRQAIESLAAEGLASVVIPAATVVERMGSERAPLGVFAARSAATLAYRELWSLVAETIGLGSTAKRGSSKKRKK
ncbi:MAG: hypothetical protein RI885_2784 [Actinomycetota bacterium]|jgi:cellulose biosynthesis protein BcsQ